MSNAFLTTIEKLNTVSPYYHIDSLPVEGEVWFTLAELIALDHPRYDEFSARIMATTPKANKRYIATNIHRYVMWMVSLIGLGAYWLDRRVPLLDAENILLFWNEHNWISRAALKDTTFYALPDDVAAGEAGVIVVEDEAALLAHFRAQYEAVSAAFIEPLRIKGTMGKTALWASAADSVVSTITTMARHLDQLDTCEPMTAALLHYDGAPFPQKVGLLWVTHETRCEPFLKRGACCLFYQVVDDKGQYCSTCPLRPLEERIESLRAHMATSA